MSNLIFAVAKGRSIEMYNNVKNNVQPASGFCISLFQTEEANGLDLRARRTMAQIYANPGNTECNFSNYVRKYLADTDLAPLPDPDDFANKRVLTFPDQTWLAAGGAVDNDIVGAIVSWYPDIANPVDSDAIPMYGMQITETTTGSGFVLVFDPVATDTVISA